MKRLMIILLGVVLVMSLEGCSSTAGWYHLPTLEFDEVDYGFEVHEAMVDGKTIAYIDEGRGEQTLLLIHGLGTNAKGWQRNIPALSRHYRVIALDLPGHGQSGGPRKGYTSEFFAEAIDAVMPAASSALTCATMSSSVIV